VKGRPSGRTLFPRTQIAVVLLCASGLAGLPHTLSSQSESHEARFQLVQSLIDAGRYAEAQFEAQGLLSKLESAPEIAPDERFHAFDLLVEALVCNGNGSQARTRELAEQAIRAREARVGPSDVSLAPSLRNFGDVLVQTGDYQAARNVYERAHSIRKLTLGPDHPDVADDLDGVVRGLTLVERYDDALAASNEALRVKQKELAATDVRIARTLELRGLLFQIRGDYPNARIAIERALEIRESANPQHPETAAAFSLFGEQQRFEGDLARAKQFGEAALALGERTLRPEHPDLAVYLRRLARPVADLGELSAARALRERGLEIAEKAFGPNHPLVAVQLNDLANILSQGGDYSTARGLYERALRIYERRLGPDHSGVTTEVYNLALVSHKLGDFSEARLQFNRAIATWERVVGPEHVFVARAVAALAEMLSEQALDAEAMVLYERALAIRERTLGKDHPDVAEVLTAMSTSAARLGQIDQAYELSLRALRIRDQPFAGDPRSVASTLVAHGTLQARLADYQGARSSYDRALLILRNMVGPSHPAVAEVHVPMAEALFKLGQPSEALHSALEGEEIGRDHLRLMLRHLPERQALEYAAKRPKGLDVAISIAESARFDDADTFDSLIRSRALVLDEMANRRHASVDASRPDLAPLWTTLVSTRQRFANLVIRGSDAQLYEQHLSLLESARRDKEQAERALAEKSATFRAELSKTEVGLNEVRAGLPTQTALIAFARYDRTPIDGSAVRPDRPSNTRNQFPAREPEPSYVAFVLRNDLPEPSLISLGAASEVDSLVARWHRETTNIIGRGSPGEALKYYRTAGAALRQRVWDPLRPYLGDVRSVFIVPDGALNVVSFAALPVGQTSYLIDRGPVIHYLAAERDLVIDDGSRATGSGLLAIGGAAFDDARRFERAPRPTSKMPSAAPGNNPVAASVRAISSDSVWAGCGALQSIQFTPLPGTNREVRDVGALWLEDSPAQVLEGRDASEQAFKREAPGHRVLHLATHGFFLGDDCAPAGAATRSVGALTTGQTKTANRPNPPKRRPSALSENPLLMSGLALAGANRRSAAGPDDDDGILTAEEVSALNLEGVEWAVLSACDTGLGEVKAGEGVFGLRRAFQVAGVRTVIMSLWPVDDQATRIWMRALYQGRLQKRLSTADAMHQASLSVLRNRRANHQSTHPFYWAAFVAAGDWR
jgi:CHAT domain-containing protein/tetratricopeptide (TPR) repeat protein